MHAQPREEMYQLKTMCLAKRTAKMPNKEEHNLLLFCGLGARRWEIGVDCNSKSFRDAILNIYPRLRTVNGYNLFTLNREKGTFTKIPDKANTPRRIRSYLGGLFTGCLMVVPQQDIVLIGEKGDTTQRDREGHALPGSVPPSPAALRRDAQPPHHPASNHQQGLAAASHLTANLNLATPFAHLSNTLHPAAAVVAANGFPSLAATSSHLLVSSAVAAAAAAAAASQDSGLDRPLLEGSRGYADSSSRSQPIYSMSQHYDLAAAAAAAKRPSVLKNTERLIRSMCLICGKMEKTPGTGSFHNISQENIGSPDGPVKISKKLNDILGINLEVQRQTYLASDQICKKCLRLVTDMLRIEEELRSCKEKLVSNFFNTMARLKKHQENSPDEEEAGRLSDGSSLLYNSVSSRRSAFVPLYQGLSDYGGSEECSSAPCSLSPVEDRRDYLPIYPHPISTSSTTSSISSSSSFNHHSYIASSETYSGRSETYVGATKSFPGPVSESGYPSRNGPGRQGNASPGVASHCSLDETTWASALAHSWSSSVLSKAQQKQYPEITNPIYKNERDEVEEAENLSTKSTDSKAGHTSATDLKEDDTCSRRLAQQQPLLAAQGERGNNMNSSDIIDSQHHSVSRHNSEDEEEERAINLCMESSNNSNTSNNQSPGSLSPSEAAGAGDDDEKSPHDGQNNGNDGNGLKQPLFMDDRGRGSNHGVPVKKRKFAKASSSTSATLEEGGTRAARTPESAANGSGDKRIKIEDEQAESVSPRESDNTLNELD